VSASLEGIIVYTDGACSGNPGPGGWGAVVVVGLREVQELGGGEPATTNNRMEMSGVIGALQFVKNVKADVTVFTDSTYVIRGITQWVWGWKRNQWKTAEGKEVSNQDLWQRMFDLVQKRKSLGEISWNYVRGHRGTPGNERCDEIAVGYSKGGRVSLYRGLVKDYPVDILSVPETEPLSEMKPKAEKVPAHSYLSVLGGIVYRHKDWASCERRVKGKSGAKFKKSTSPDHEKEILKSWGLNSSCEIKEG
jgi:ribonuclease HI